MAGVLLVIHYFTCFAMILVILLQSGKGGGLAGAFGGGGSTIFGGRGAGTVLTRATMVLGAMFFVTSLSLALISAQGGPTGTSSSKSLIQEEAKRAAQTQPTSGPAQSGAPAGRQTLPPAGTQTPTQTAPAPATNPAPAPGGTK